MKLTTKKVLATALTVSFLALPMLAMADDVFGLNYATASGLTSSDIRTTIARIINVVLTLLGIVCVVIVIAGGFLWLTAAGNEEKVEKAKKMLGSGVIGLVIILSAYAIARFVLNSLQNATA